MGGIIDFLIQLYFSQVYAGVKTKMYSKSLSFAITIAEINNSRSHLKKLNYIYENTTESMGVPLPILEDLMEQATRGTPKMKTYSIYGKEVYYHQIIKALSDAYIEITVCVTKIAKDLGVDIPFDMGKYQVQND